MERARTTRAMLGAVGFRLTEEGGHGLASVLKPLTEEQKAEVHAGTSSLRPGAGRSSDGFA
jgi:hypothetical protein